MQNTPESPMVRRQLVRRERLWPYALAVTLAHGAALLLAWWATRQPDPMPQDRAGIVQVELLSFVPAAVEAVPEPVAAVVEPTRPSAPPIPPAPPAPPGSSTPVRAPEPVLQQSQPIAPAEAVELKKAPTEPPPEVAASSAEQSPPDVVVDRMVASQTPVPEPDPPPPSPPSPPLPSKAPTPPTPTPGTPERPAAASPAPSVPVRPARQSVAAALSSPPSFDAGYLKNPAPRYPVQALRQRVEGTVVLSVHVLPSGHSDTVKVSKSSGSDLLDEAALRTVKAWRFKPALADGKAVAQWVSVPITFRIKPN